MLNRRQFVALATGMGTSLLVPRMSQGELAKPFLSAPHHRARAKRIIYLYQAGGPSQFETLDYKPEMAKMHGKPLPPGIRRGQRLTGMSGNQSEILVANSPYKFEQAGQSGHWISELMPHTAKVIDDICIVKTMYTEAINHGPANTFMQTGSQIPGRPSIGAWLQYGLGSGNPNLPPFVVMLTKGKGGQPLFARLWGNGFLPSRYQGVKFRAEKDPVVFLNNPGGVSQASRGSVVDHINQLQQLQSARTGDGEIESQIANYDMALRMQANIPEAVDVTKEPDYIFDMYGPDAKKPGTYAANCIQARRLAERGVNFIQLYHPGWDQHGKCASGVKSQCRETDQASAALLTDLKMRGLLDDTLVIWGGEFGRTAYCQGGFGPNYGRDHHPRCFPIWMAGGGIQGGMSYGETDALSYNIVEGSGKVHIHDFHATLMHLLGIDHERLTYKFQGRRYRLTDVHGHVVKDLLV